MKKYKNIDSFFLIFIIVIIISLIIFYYNINTYIELYEDKKEIVDIFIKTYHKDYEWLEYLIKSIKKFASGFRNVIIVSDNDGHTIPDHIKEIMPLTIFYTDIPTDTSNLDFLGNKNIGYTYQQHIKLSWMNYTDADAILLLDSDEMLTEKTTPEHFKNNGKYNWYYSEWDENLDDIVWRAAVDKIFQIKSKYNSMRITGFIFTKNTTNKLYNFIKEKHNVNNFWELIIKEQLASFSEYNIYGTFIRTIDDTDYNILSIDNDLKVHNHTIIKSWSYGEFTQENKDKRNSILNS